MGKFLRKIVLVMALVVISVSVSGWIGGHAEEYEKLVYKTVGSFEEYWNLIDSDDVAMTYNKESLSYIDKIWCVEVDEPGWFVFSSYNYGADYGMNNHCYMFTNAMFTDKLNTFSETKYIGGDIFYERYDYRFFLAGGKYYFKIKSEESNLYIGGDGIARFRYYFIPSKLELKIDNISYNDGNTTATVFFTPVSDNIMNYAFFDKALKNDKEMTDFYSSHCIDWWSGAYSDHREKIESYIKDGIEISKNGTYSIVIRYNDDEYINFYSLAEFTIDKIGAEPSKVEAKSLKLSKTKVTMNPKDILQLKATFKPKNVTEQTITWKSSNKKVAIVDKTGKVTAKKKGTCVITAITSNGKKAKCKITVKK